MPGQWSGHSSPVSGHSTPVSDQWVVTALQCQVTTLQIDHYRHIVFSFRSVKRYPFSVMSMGRSHSHSSAMPCHSNVRQVGRSRCFGVRSMDKSHPSSVRSGGTAHPSSDRSVGRSRCFGVRSMDKSHPSSVKSMNNVGSSDKNNSYLIIRTWHRLD